MELLQKQAVNTFANKLIEKLAEEQNEYNAAFFVQDHNHYFLGLSHGMAEAIKIIEREILNNKEEEK